MIHTFIGKKLKMSQVFDEAGMRQVVTEVDAAPVTIVQIKSTEKDGYTAVQLGGQFKPAKRIAKPLEGHLKKAGLGVQKPRFLREVRFSGELDVEKMAVGKTIAVSDVLAVGDTVSVTGTSKSKGFQGVVKRHGFRGGPRTHGQSDRERAPGSIGQTTTPGRVYKGKKMAGRMGGEQVTTSGLTVIALNPETNRLLIKGAIPGNSNSFVLIEKHV